MAKPIYLSYSTINSFYKSPHFWINKMLGIQQPENQYMIAGREAHKIVTDHICGVKKDPRIPLDLEFQKPEYKVFSPYNDKYSLYGFCDAVSFNSKTIFEYKTSTKPWSQGQFEKLMQIPFYALTTGFRKIFMVTSTSDFQNFKTFYKEVTDEEIKKVKEWIDTAIQNIEEGRFYDDLDENRKCKGCDIGPACFFA